MSLNCVNDVAIIRPHGDLDLAKEGLLTRTLHSLLNAQAYKVILDLSEVQHVNSQVLERLARTIAVFRNHYGDVRFVGMTPYLQKIFIVAISELQLRQFRVMGEALLSFDDGPWYDAVMN